MKPKLLLLEDFDNLEAKKKLSEYVDFVDFTDSNSGQVDGAYIKLAPHTFHKTGFYNVYPNLKFVATPCTGTEHIKIPEGVKLIHLDQEFKDGVGKQITSTSEHTLSLMLQLAKKKRMQLSGKTLGVIGYGRIGEMVSRYGVSMGMFVDGYDKYKSNEWVDYVYDGNGFRISNDLEKLLKESDVISIHVPLNEETCGLIGEKEIEMMKDGAMIINTSRQEIIDVNYLHMRMMTSAGYFGSKKILYYADDFKNVFDFQDSKAVQTEHIGGNCLESRMITDMYIADKIIEYLGGRIND